MNVIVKALGIPQQSPHSLIANEDSTSILKWSDVMVAAVSNGYLAHCAV
jgi:hypothetical protein